MADDREITVKTPLGPDDLLFARMEGEDRISTCFEFTLEMVSEDPDISADKLLGEAVTVKLGADGERYFHAYVTRFGLKEFRGGYAHYTADLRPWLWFLSISQDCRIFQNMSVVEIIEEVFGEYPNASFEKRLQGSYPTRDYCVQYDESDLDFVQRLMEHEGIFYFFEYSDGDHLLVLTDANSELGPNPGFDTIPYHSDGAPVGVHDFITDWSPRAAVMSGAYTHTDYDFTKPSADLMAKSELLLGHAQDAAEVYSNPGSHLALDRGDTIALIRREELQARARRADARGSVRGLWSGCTFTLSDFPREAENDEYIVIWQQYRLWDPQYRTGLEAEGSSLGFEVKMRVAPTSVPFRPWRRTSVPVMRGPQTATVVGPSGEEIYTDEHSRVKVQFHWDRLGARDEASSCWVRVSSVWAGSGWGFIQIPRIGQEVIVDFIEGDPDKPIITGRVYNGENMPPYELPGNATQSGWKSNSSPGGGGWNELRFEDKAGEEEVYFQAQKNHTELIKNDEARLIQHDMQERVDNNSNQSIGVDRTEDVGNDKTTQVGHDRSVSIGNNDTETVGVNRSLSVGVDETISIGSNSTESIGMNHTQKVGAAQVIAVTAARTDNVGAAEARTVGGEQVNTIGRDRSVTVGGGQTHTISSDDGHTVGGGQTVSVGKDQSMDISGNQSFTTGGGRLVKVGKGQTHDVAEDVWIKAGKSMMLEAADSITLKCGSSTIVMKKDGTITIEGKDISMKGSGKINVKASSDITLKGSKINQN